MTDTLVDAYSEIEEAKLKVLKIAKSMNLDLSGDHGDTLIRLSVLLASSSTFATHKDGEPLRHFRPGLPAIKILLTMVKDTKDAVYYSHATDPVVFTSLCHLLAESDETRYPPARITQWAHRLLKIFEPDDYTHLDIQRAAQEAGIKALAKALKIKRG